MSVVIEDGLIFFECVKCGIGIIIPINELNCKIFRCGVYKDTNIPINPHTLKETCKQLVDQKLILGCGCAFELLKTTDSFDVVECDYSR